MPNKASFKGGLDLKFLTDPAFESLDHAAQEKRAPIISRNALRLLMMGWPESWTQLLSWATLKAVFIQRDPALLKEFRLAFQQGFDTLFIQLKGQPLNNEQHEQVQLYLSNCLSLLPYSDLTPYESIRIPQYIEDQWVLVEYYVNPIELTQKNKGTLKDRDRVFAYGLEPITHQKASSHLIFMGTTYPAGQGFVPQITTDFEAFETVGNSLYLSGRQKIHDWLLKQKDKVHVCGVSLGGSLSLLLAIDLGCYLSRVDALNPAGLHHLRVKSDYDRWDELHSKPQVVIQQQANDPVSLLGVWKSDWEIIQVTPPKNKEGPNPFCDHFMNYAGFADTVFTYTMNETENTKRKARNLLLYSIIRGAIYYFVINPYNNFIRPAKYSILEHKTSYFILLTTFISAGILLGIVFSGLFSGALFLGAFSLIGTVSGLLFVPVLLMAIIAREATVENDYEMEPAKLHHPGLPRNSDMNTYSQNHLIEVDFTYKELHTYYKVMRTLVKEKELLPVDERKVVKGTDLSKKELLTETPEHDNKFVTVKTTKAKIVHMKHVLTFIDHLGYENTKELKKVLERNYTDYLKGKGNELSVPDNNQDDSSYIPSLT